MHTGADPFPSSTRPSSKSTLETAARAAFGSASRCAGSVVRVRFRQRLDGSRGGAVGLMSAWLVWLWGDRTHRMS